MNILVDLVCQAVVLKLHVEGTTVESKLVFFSYVKENVIDFENKDDTER